MNKIIVLLTTIFMLSGCGSIPTAVDTVAVAEGSVVTEASQAEVAAGENGIGTVAYDKTTRAKDCPKIRRTGSHQYITMCDDPDGGSQPVRYGGWHDLGRYAMSGSVWPADY